MTVHKNADIKKEKCPVWFHLAIINIFNKLLWLATIFSGIKISGNSVQCVTIVECPMFIL